MVLREDDICKMAGPSTSYLYLSCESFRDVVIEAFLHRHATSRLSAYDLMRGLKSGKQRQCKRRTLTESCPYIRCESSRLSQSSHCALSRIGQRIHQPLVFDSVGISFHLAHQNLGAQGAPRFEWSVYRIGGGKKEPDKNACVLIEVGP